MDWPRGFDGKKATVTTPSVSNLSLVDSSGWIEYFGEGPKASQFAPYLERESSLLVPSIVLYEVQKKLLLTRGVTSAQQFYSQALRARPVALNFLLAMAAAEISLEHHLAMADAIIYATAQAFGAKLITSDPHFGKLPGVTML